MVECKLRKKPRLRDLILRIPVYDALLAILNTFVPAVNAYSKFAIADLLSGCTYGAVAAVAIPLTLIKAHRSVVDQRDQEWLYPFLHMLADILQGLGAKDDSLRVCLLAQQGQDQMVQLTEYVGNSVSSGKIHRKFPRRRGIVWLALNQPNVTVVASVPKGVPREKYLVQSLFFQKNEVNQVNQKANSWAAICVGQPDGFQVVIFCDCEKAGYFGTKQNNSRRKALNAAGVSLARHLVSR